MMIPFFATPTTERKLPRGTMVPGIIREVACAAVVSGTVITVGNTLAWPVMLHSIANETTTGIHEEDIEWLATIPSLISIIFPLFAGVLAEVFGPCRVLTLCLPASAFLWLLLAFLPSKPIIYLVRAALGATAMAINTLIQPLTSELVSADVRGLLASFPETMHAMGVVHLYVMARALPWHTTTALCAVPPCILFLLLLFVPESPYWSMKKGKEHKAHHDLQMLRGPEGRVLEELDSIRRAYTEQPSQSVMDQVIQLTVSSNYKPVLLVYVIFVLKEMGGQPIMFQYTVFLFREAQVKLDPFTCTILVGLVNLVFSVISALIIDSVGRRPLLVGSGVICAASLSVMGAILISPTAPRWLIIVCIMSFVVSYSCGVGTVPWLLVGELLPTAVRSIGCAICMVGHYLTFFIITITYPSMEKDIGMASSLFIYAFFNFLLIFVTLKWVPETRCRTLAELQSAFSSENSELMYRRISLRQSIDLGLEIASEIDLLTKAKKSRSELQIDVLMDHTPSSSSSKIPDYQETYFPFTVRRRSEDSADSQTTLPERNKR
ncbi:facilitated trehalose transporter Tret1-like [Oratosquilla oratoria]|uniref:facilitated trehalose transporter Tret1-like n=1 Tax=Oratosquilla oratoria TaxID=337810 RepID=UPI003F763381